MGGAPENIVIVIILAMQHPAGDRIKECFGKLGTPVLVEQAHVCTFDFGPWTIVALRVGEPLDQCVYGFFDPQVIHLNPFSVGISTTRPVGTFESRLRPSADFTKQAIVTVETL